MGEVHLRSDERSNLHDQLGARHSEEDIATAALTQLLLDQLKAIPAGAFQHEEP